MTIAVLKEPSFETRVSLLPEHIAALIKLNVQVLVETDAGAKAFASNEKYVEAGARVVSMKDITDSADLLLRIHLPEESIINTCKPGTVILGLYQPLYQANQIQNYAKRGITIFSIDMLPRTTRAQSMDVLSSQANIAGYKAVLLAAMHYPRYFPMFMTAAGTVPPAKMLILGAGVAGLQAVATARRLGAAVEVFDTRPAVKEEVMSLGAKFVEVEGAADATAAGGYAVEQSAEFIERQKQKIAESVAKADVVITTAQIPGKKAPILITTAMIEKMKPGSVIIDLAAVTGGNTECTKNNETVVSNGVLIIGNSFLAGEMSSDASKLYGKNMVNFLQLIVAADGTLKLNFEDDLVKGTCIATNNEITNERINGLLG